MSNFFVSHQVTTSTDASNLRRVLLLGDNDAIYDLAKHWFTGSRLVRHSSNEALFLMEEEALVSFVPHILLPFGRSVRVVEPASLKRRMLELVSQLVSFYEEVD